MDTTEQHSFRRWIRILAIAVANVLLLAFFASYFSGQKLEIVNLIGIIGDSLGIVTGLLGIWFFFLSEQLNRKTAINLERSASTVEDLRSQMWNMIDKTFSTFINREDELQTEETENAIQLLKDELATVLEEETPTKKYIEAALSTITRRLESLESIRDIRPYTFQPKVTSLSLSREVEMLLASAFKDKDEVQAGELSLYLEDNDVTPKQFMSTTWGEAMNLLAKTDYINVNLPPNFRRIGTRTRMQYGHALRHQVNSIRKSEEFNSQDADPKEGESIGKSQPSD